MIWYLIFDMLYCMQYDYNFCSCWCAEDTVVGVKQKQNRATYKPFISKHENNRVIIFSVILGAMQSTNSRAG